jgi:DNA-binding NarL/FixJ family response regulator
MAGQVPFLYDPIKRAPPKIARLSAFSVGLRSSPRIHETSLTREMSSSHEQPSWSSQTKAPDAFSLSGREEQVARCVATTLMNKEIADTLFISEQTVKHHLSRIFHETGAKDRFEVALWMICQDQACVTERYHRR